MEDSGWGPILAGFDESPGSRDALTLAKALADAGGAELLLAAVRPYHRAALGREAFAAALREDEEWIAREAPEILGPTPFSIRVLTGVRPADGLKDTAAAAGVEAIVVGSTHRGRLRRVLAGSVGERVLDGAPCAVAVAPLGLAGTGFELRQIAVAYDGSREANAALELAVRMAEPAGASLLLLGAVEATLDLTGFEQVSPEQLEMARLTRHLRRARERLPRSVPVSSRLLCGRADRVILEAAEEADLLVVGSRGHYGPVRRVLLGSVATAVTRDAPCATLVTPAP